MSKFEKKAKCPKCLPDVAGAYFKADFVGEGKSEWVCNNCGYRTPRRTNKPSGRITPSQKRVIDLLTSYGWTLETKMIGSAVWVSGRKDRSNPGMNLIAGDSFYGTIGTRGAISLTLQRIGKDVSIDDDIGMSVYLK